MPFIEPTFKPEVEYKRFEIEKGKLKETKKSKKTKIRARSGTGKIRGTLRKFLEPEFKKNVRRSGRVVKLETELEDRLTDSHKRLEQETKEKKKNIEAYEELRQGAKDDITLLKTQYEAMSETQKANAIRDINTKYKINLDTTTLTTENIDNILDTQFQSKLKEVEKDKVKVEEERQLFEKNLKKIYKTQEELTKKTNKLNSSDLERRLQTGKETKRWYKTKKATNLKARLLRRYLYAEGSKNMTAQQIFDDIKQKYGNKYSSDSSVKSLVNEIQRYKARTQFQTQVNSVKQKLRETQGKIGERVNTLRRREDLQTKIEALTGTADTAQKTKMEKTLKGFMDTFVSKSKNPNVELLKEITNSGGIFNGSNSSNFDDLLKNLEITIKSNGLDEKYKDLAKKLAEDPEARKEYESTVQIETAKLPNEDRIFMEEQIKRQKAKSNFTNLKYNVEIQIRNAARYGSFKDALDTLSNKNLQYSGKSVSQIAETLKGKAKNNQSLTLEEQAFNNQYYQFLDSAIVENKNKNPDIQYPKETPNVADLTSLTVANADNQNLTALTNLFTQQFKTDAAQKTEYNPKLAQNKALYGNTIGELLTQLEVSDKIPDPNGVKAKLENLLNAGISSGKLTSTNSSTIEEMKANLMAKFEAAMKKSDGNNKETMTASTSP